MDRSKRSSHPLTSVPRLRLGLRSRAAGRAAIVGSAALTGLALLDGPALAQAGAGAADPPAATESLPAPNKPAPASLSEPSAIASPTSPSSLPEPAPGPGTDGASPLGPPAVEEPKSEDPKEVTVVGTRARETSGSAHILREKQLRRFGQQDPHQILQSVPGVYVRGEDGFGLRPNVGIVVGMSARFTATVQGALRF